MGNDNKANGKHKKIGYCKMKEINTNRKERCKRRNSGRLGK
jgi:hypothetical protein